jgi:hypothetical protein
MLEPGNTAARRKRLSLPRSATDDGIVAELLSLLETVTADGRITEDEIKALHTWLDDNAATGLTGIEFLRTTVNEILADGVVTADERTAVYKAVERVLPPEARRGAKERRGAVALVEKSAARAEKEKAREQARNERLRNRPLASANFMVAGVLYEGRGAIVDRLASAGDDVRLVRDPANAHDANAIQVRLTTGEHIGFAPREDASRLAPIMDSGFRYEAYITKILAGRRAPIPVVQTYLVNADASVVARREPLQSAYEPAPTVGRDAASAGSKAGGCGLLVVFGLIVMFAMFKMCGG